MNELLEKIDKTILFFVIYTICFIVFFSTLNYTLPFVLALLCAFLLKKPTFYLMEKFKLKNSSASLITTIVFFAIIISLLSWGITSLTQECIQLGKNAQSYISTNGYTDMNGLMEKMNVYYKNLDPQIAKIIESNVSNITSKLSSLTVGISTKVLNAFVSFVTSVPYIIMLILFTLLATYFFTRDITASNKTLEKYLSKGHSDKLFFIFNETKRMLGNYIISYMIIIGVTFAETIVVFLIFKVKYAVLLSVLCAFFDILPIFGIGAIYIPLAIIYFFSKSYIQAFGLIISYVIVSIIRQLIEPKIVSSTLGIHPVAVLAALFIGLKANGLSGMFFCIFLVVFYNIFEKVNVL